MPPRRSYATARAAAAATPMTAAAVEQSKQECLRHLLTMKLFKIALIVMATKDTILKMELEELYALPMSMESMFHISNCAVENQVKFATCTFLGNALTWWNSHMKTV
ncbi:hypothetical protein Tco_1442160, partial [Tanacetum coccineum]